MKPILPSLKERKRYVVFEIISKSKIKAFSSVSKALKSRALSFAGEEGASGMGLQVLKEKYDGRLQRGIARVSASTTDQFKAALAMIEEMEDQPVLVRSLGVSGILAKAEKYIAA